MTSLFLFSMFFCCFYFPFGWAVKPGGSSLLTTVTTGGIFFQPTRLVSFVKVSSLYIFFQKTLRDCLCPAKLWWIRPQLQPILQPAPRRLPLLLWGLEAAIVYPGHTHSTVPPDNASSPSSRKFIFQSLAVLGEHTYVCSTVEGTRRVLQKVFILLKLFHI